ncbi:mediator complex subunit NUT2 [Sporobolomyces salmoneus]|uniref:mediator complex subunit NUT2 n=1 Tax=Sporobolomyces salmoneus TaxID=183962 RepID=UPI00316D9D09
MSHPNSSSAPLPPRIGIEQSLEQLLQSLLELGICASDVQESALESSPQGVASGQPGGLIGRKATQTIESFARLHSIKDSVGDVMIPLEVISTVDAGKNPHLFTKDFIERLSGENMYTNGILSAVSGYRDLLTEQMKDAFPDLVDFLDQPSPFSAPPAQSTSSEPQPSLPDEILPPASNGFLPESYANGNGDGTEALNLAATTSIGVQAQEQQMLNGSQGQNGSGGGVSSEDVKMEG